MATEQATAVLAAKDDQYGGVIVEADTLPAEQSAFEAALGESLQAWTQAGKKGVWLKVPLAHAALIAPAVNKGFKFHHAEESYVMMTHWLPEVPSTLPPNASHQVGVGAFVVNERGEVLVVQEKNGPLKGKGIWKMPTGLAHAGEDISETAEREVWEETGIQASFQGVLAIRQAHGFAFGKSDLFFLCALKPTPGQEEVRPCETEIEAARWLPLQEYQQQQLAFNGHLPLYQTMMDRCMVYAKGAYSGLKAGKLESGIWKPRQDLLLWGDDDAAGAGAAAANGAEAASSL